MIWARAQNHGSLITLRAESAFRARRHRTAVLSGGSSGWQLTPGGACTHANYRMVMRISNARYSAEGEVDVQRRVRQMGVIQGVRLPPGPEAGEGLRGAVKG
jgi:hypothetical protein